MTLPFIAIAMAPWTNALIVASMLAVSGAVLSVLVVLRRWAFVGEGIAHAGIGGAGTAWLLMLLIPSLQKPWVPYVAVVIFCLLIAMVIGWVTRREWINADTAIGIFLVASLAWGFLAQSIYTSARHGVSPDGWDTFIFGQMGAISGQYVVASVALCIAVLSIVILLGKEILFYVMDPDLAEVSGVPARVIHYLLMLLLAVTIIIGTKIVGGVLVTALLVLPGATALQFSRNLKVVISIAIAAGLVSSTASILANEFRREIPTGPAMVLVLFVLFVCSLGFRRALRK